MNRAEAGFSKTGLAAHTAMKAPIQMLGVEKHDRTLLSREIINRRLFCVIVGETWHELRGLIVEFPFWDSMRSWSSPDKVRGSGVPQTWMPLSPTNESDSCLSLLGLLEK